MISENDSISPNGGKQSKVKRQRNYSKIIDTTKYKKIRSKVSYKKTKREVFDNLRCQIINVRSINVTDIKELKSHSSFLNELLDLTQKNEIQNEEKHLETVKINNITQIEQCDATQICLKDNDSQSESEKIKNYNFYVDKDKVSTVDNKKTCYFDVKKAIEIKEQSKKLANENLETKTELFYKQRDIRPLLISRKQELYLEILYELNNEKFSLPCRCPLDIKRNTFTWFVKKSKLLLQAVECTIRILFDKNRGRSIYERVAFWPCPTEYFFYKTNGNIFFDNSLKEKEDKTYILPNDEVVLPLKKEDIKIKISKVKNEVDYEGLYLFGYNHPCYRNEDPIQFFFVKSNNDTIACAYVQHFLRARYLIIFSHPNGTDISDNIIGFPNLLDFARFMEVNLISYDYSGYGISNGIPNENTLVGNLQSVLEYAKNVLNYPEERIILWGYSLGGAISALVARNNKNIGGLILYGAPASIKAVIKTKIFKKKVIKDKYIQNTPFNTAEAVKEVECPTLVIHSIKDSLISHIHGLKIFQNAKTPVLPLLLENSSHDFMDVAHEGWKKIREFLEYEIAFVHSNDTLPT